MPAVLPDEELAAAGVVAGCAALLRAAAQRLDPTWSAAAAAAFGNGVLVVLMESDATDPTRSRLFTSDRAHASTGGISPELVRAFGQAAGGFVHATRICTDAQSPSRRLQIGPPPRVRVMNGGDAMATIRAVAGLPTGARLVPPE